MVASYPIKMIPLIYGQSHSSRQRMEQLVRWLGPPLLFEPGVVVRRHSRQLSHFTPPQPWDAPPSSHPQADILGAKAFTASAKEVCEL
jgi:hypothetical protein